MILFILLILFRFNVICLKEKKRKEKKRNITTATIIHSSCNSAPNAEYNRGKYC